MHLSLKKAIQNFISSESELNRLDFRLECRGCVTGFFIYVTSAEESLKTDHHNNKSQRRMDNIVFVSTHPTYAAPSYYSGAAQTSTHTLTSSLPSPSKMKSLEKHVVTTQSLIKIIVKFQCIRSIQKLIMLQFFMFLFCLVSFSFFQIEFQKEKYKFIQNIKNINEKYQEKN